MGDEASFDQDKPTIGMKLAKRLGIQPKEKYSGTQFIYSMRW